MRKSTSPIVPIVTAHGIAWALAIAALAVSCDVVPNRKERAPSPERAPSSTTIAAPAASALSASIDPVTHAPVLHAPPLPPNAPAYDELSSHGRVADVFASNEDAGTVTFIDSHDNAVIDVVAVGRRPRGVKLSPDGATLFVAVSGTPKAGPPSTRTSQHTSLHNSNTGAGGSDDDAPPANVDRSKDGIAVVDIASGKLVRTIESGIDPEAFDVSPDGKRIYVSNEDAGTLSVVDVDSGKVTARVPVGKEPEGVTVSRDGKWVWVTSEADGTVSAIDASTNDVVATVKVGARPRGIAITRDGKRAFVTAENAASVSIVDAIAKKNVATIALPKGARPMGVALTRDDATLFVSNGRAGSIAVVDVKTGAVKNTIPAVGARPWGLALSPDGKKLFVACGPSNEIAVVDVATQTVTARLTSTGSPWGVAAEKRALRVCADPNNMPFSNEKGEGFDNQIASVIADALDARLVTTWRPERRGFVRHTVKAGLCDVVIGVPVGAPGIDTTPPLYRSSYVFVARKDRAHKFASLDDDLLKTVTIGAHMMGDDGAAAPPVDALIRRGLADRVVGYSITGDYHEADPPAALIDAVDAGLVDVALAWGPLAGWYAKKSKHPLVVNAVTPEREGASKFAFDMAVGVKKGDTALLDDVERAIISRRPDIDRILDAYGVPRVR